MHIADGLNSLQGREAGKHVLIVGGGPSGKRWDTEFEVGIGADVVIAINGAIQGSSAHYWLCLEGDNQPLIRKWYAAAACAVRIMHPVMKQPCPDALFIGRSSNEPNPREVNKGLRLDGGKELAGSITRRTGTSAMSALHLAAFLGCAAAYTIGVDLCGVDHWYDNPDTVVAPGNRVYTLPDGRTSVDFMFWSGFALVEYRKRLAAVGMEWQDLSGGLIGMIDRGEVTEACEYVTI